MNNNHCLPIHRMVLITQTVKPYFPFLKNGKGRKKIPNGIQVTASFIIYTDEKQAIRPGDVILVGELALLIKNNNNGVITAHYRTQGINEFAFIPSHEGLLISKPYAEGSLA